MRLHYCQEQEIVQFVTVNILIHISTHLSYAICISSILSIDCIDNNAGTEIAHRTAEDS